MKPKITLENIHTFSIPLAEHNMKWVFEEEDKKISPEFEDQIIALNLDASRFLRNFENSQKYFSSISAIRKYFNQHDEFLIGNNDNQKIKKWLYQLGIPFDKKVFWISDSNRGFILTWKMVIKFSDVLFFRSDELIWDNTLNWALAYDHNEVFTFGKNRNFNAQKHSDEIDEIKKMIAKNNK